MLNNLLCAAGIDEKFITLSLSVLDLEQPPLTLCSAGHLPLLLRRADGTVEEIGEDIAGFPLGIMPDVDYQQAEVDLHPGDVVVIYSDGVTDARNPARSSTTRARTAACSSGSPSRPGGPEAVGRSILQDIREFSAGHTQADDITLICFGPSRLQTDRVRFAELTMSLKVANLRLELDEPEERLPEKSRERLGVGPEAIARWRILRKSLDARRHDDLHFVYAAEVELPERRASALRRRRSLGPDVEPFRARALRLARAGPEPLEHRPVIVGAGPAGLFAGYLLAQDGYRPLILERGRDGQGPRRRRPPVRRRRAARPREQLPLRRGRRGHVQRRQAHQPRAPAPTSAASSKSWPTATASPRSSTSTAPISARTGCRWSSGPSAASSRSWAARSGSPAGSRTSTSPNGRLRGLMTSSGSIAADVAVLAIGHSARDTYGMLLRRGVPLEAKPFQLGVRIEQPQEQVNVARYGRVRRPPRPRRGRLQPGRPRRRPRPVHLLHVRRRLRDAAA